MMTTKDEINPIETPKVASLMESNTLAYFTNLSIIILKVL